MLPDLILTNGRIVTLDAHDRIAEAVAVGGDRIVAVGDSAAVAALGGQGARVVDLRGRMVIPGLCDAHFQFFDRAPLGYMGADTSLAATVGEVLDRVREAARRTPPGQVITSNPGWYPHMLAEGRNPTRAELDAAAPEHAVVLRGEFVYLNTLALQRFNITRDTPQPDHGWIGKDANGEPDGVLYGAATKLAPGAHFESDEEARMGHLRRAMDEMLASGVTSLRDPKLSMSDIRTYQKMRARGDLPLRVSVQHFVESSRPPEEVVADFDRFQPLTPIGDHWLRIDRAGYFYLDGGYHRMKTSAPFVNRNPVPDDGNSYYEPEQSLQSLRTIVGGLAARGFTGSLMAAGDVSIGVALDVLEDVDRVTPIAGKRWVLAHAIWPNKEQLARCARLGLVLTPMWHHLYYWPTLSFYYGDAFAQRADPFRDMIDAGVTVAMGTDVSKTPLNYFRGLEYCVTRETERWGKAGADQAISRLEALRTMTVNCAYLTFEEDVKGAIEPGKLADLVLLSDDYLEIEASRIREIRPLATLVGGEVRFGSLEP
jgi:predicted amidohydrolase YtcJ